MTSASALDHLDAEAFGPLGDRPAVVIDLGRHDALREAKRLSGAGAIVIGADRSGAMPEIDIDLFDCLLTPVTNPASPWVWAADPLAAGVRLLQAVARSPIAASTVCRVLRITPSLGVSDALAVESFAYSTLLGGAEFRRYLRMRATPSPTFAAQFPVDVSRQGDQLTLTLNSPTSRNAMNAAMRDALWEALATALDDPTQPNVLIRGAGGCFSVGGALDEFGLAGDLAEAHAVRTARSCTGLLIALGERSQVILHGACIGSGLEIPAGAARLEARPGAFFQLPELAMGLMPGAGGTVTLHRRIGRHRTAWLALSGRRLPARLALEWGLVTAIRP